MRKDSNAQRPSLADRIPLLGRSTN